MSSFPSYPSAPPHVASGTKVAVTGASGFIGSRLVERLVEQGAIVTCLLRGAAGARLRATGAHCLALDLADDDAVAAALQDVQWLFHCAYDWDDPDWNRRALTSLIRACRITKCRLVHVSSFVVYDVPPVGELTEENAASPDRSGYAHVKMLLERDLMEAVRAGGIEASIIQPTIVYGPYSKPWTIDPADMLLNGTVILPDRGQGVCNAVYVDDVIDAMILAAQVSGALGKRFLVSGDPVSWAAFYEAMADAVGAKHPVYMPAETIALEHDRVVRLKRLLSSPSMLLRRVATRGPIGGMLRRGLTLVPRPVSSSIENQLLAPLERKRGHRHMPDRGRLEFLQGRGTVHSLRARRDIGYAPRHDLSAGMKQTERYLRDTYRKP